ncbi:nuclear distribution protein nudF [Lentinula aciculospora]|uniref:Nuclear distribution protein nudF n=1 Tax=Lentinula aciculospora TaxID=153920 RepID=A0A9W9DWY6_9AGAR|nr:nuclear distribution protein nudF [Lentinula aciculospora]
MTTPPTASSSQTAPTTRFTPPRPQSPSPSTSDFSLIGPEELESSDHADYSFWSYNTSTPYKGFGSFGRRGAIYSTPTLNYFASSIPFPSSSSTGVDQDTTSPGTSLKTLLPRLWDVLVSSPTKNIISTSRSPISLRNFVPLNSVDSPLDTHRHSMFPNYISHSPTPTLSCLNKGKGKANNYATRSSHYTEQSYCGDNSDFWTQCSSLDRSTKRLSITSQYSYINYSDLPPLDGEEGELIDVDDEGCFLPSDQFHYGGTMWRGGMKGSFSRARVVTGIDILSLLPVEVALRVLEFLASGSPYQFPDSSGRSPQSSSLWTSRVPYIQEASTPEQCLQDILICASVSKTWRQLSQDNSVWRTLFESRWGDGKFGGGITKDSAAIQKYLSGQRKTTIGRDKDLPALPVDSSSSIQIIQSSSLDYLTLYQDRLELERRWVGTAFIKRSVASACSPPSSNGGLSVSPSRSSSLTPMYIADQTSPYSTLTSSRSSSSSTTIGISDYRHALPVPNSPVTLTENWDKWEPDIMQLSGHSDSVYCIELPSSSTFAADKFFVTGSRDRTIKMWSSKTAKCIGTFGRGRAPTSHEMHEGSSQEVDTVTGHAGSVLCLKFFWKEGSDATDDNDSMFVEDIVVRKGVMFSGSSDCTICVWDVCMTHNLAEDQYEVEAHVSTVLRGHSGGVLDLKVDDNWIVSCSKDTTIRVWNRQTLTAHRILRGHEGPVNAVGMEDGRVVSASGDGKMILWDVSSGERLRTFEGHDRGLACIEYSSGLIISGSNDCNIKIWSALTGKCLRTLQGHEALVRALAFDPAIGLLASASYDKSVRVWDIKDVLNGTESNKESSLRVFMNVHTSHIFDVKFDVGRIVSTSHDQKIVVADFSCGLDNAHLFL